MPGQLPDPKARRRNAPTIPTTVLPAGGRTGPVPAPPKWIHLGRAGLAWWAWAWKTPQAAAWSTGDHVVIARRAGIEDDLAALHEGPVVNVAYLLDVDEDDRTAELEWLIRTLLRVATGKTTRDREARELDDRLGLTPKALATLRWTIQEPETRKTSRAKAPAAKRSRMQVLDGGAAS